MGRDEESLSDDSQRALQIMSDWAWERCDPDGFNWDHWCNLAEAINRLAFAGHKNPKQSMLRLLCSQKVLARGSYNWKRYHGGDTFGYDSFSDVFPIDRWKTLATALEDEERSWQDHEWPCGTVNLKYLNLEECRLVSWDFAQSSFSYALCPPDVPSSHPLYFEEFFSGWNIEIRPAFEPESSDIAATEKPGSADFGSGIDQPSKPPLSLAELHRWWASKASVRDHLTKDELLALVRAKYPDKHISRDTMRELAGPRKKGPK